MRGVKGCFVCGEYYRSNAHHCREKVTKEIGNLKQRHLKFFLSVEDLAVVVHMANLFLDECVLKKRRSSVGCGRGDGEKWGVNGVHCNG